MIVTEKMYRQIKKEALALIWACKYLADYLVGLQFHIKIAHNPLITLFSIKHLEDLPIRIQRFRMCFMGFLFTISHVPGKHLITTDALSTALLTSFPKGEEDLHKAVDMYTCAILSTIPATDSRVKQIQMSQADDEVCQQLIEFCKDDWSNRKNLPGILT